MSDLYALKYFNKNTSWFEIVIDLIKVVEIKEAPVGCAYYFENGMKFKVPSGFSCLNNHIMRNIYKKMSNILTMNSGYLEQLSLSLNLISKHSYFHTDIAIHSTHYYKLW